MRSVSKFITIILVLLCATLTGHAAEEFFPEKSSVLLSEQEILLAEWQTRIMEQWQQPVLRPNTIAPTLDEFDFDDGTLQGWLLAGVFDDALNGPLTHNLTVAWDDDTNFPGLYQTDPADLNGCMALNVTNLSVANPHGKTLWGAFLTSPDLSGSADWRDSEGIVISSLDAFNFVSGHPRGASLAILVRDTDTSTDKLLALLPTFHPHYTNPALAATNGWARLPIPWSAFAGLPANYVVKFVSIVIMGEMTQTISGQFCIDEITPMEAQIAATRFDFDDGTAQGWTADGPYDPTGTALTSNFMASWVDDTNHPDAIGTDPLGDGNGAFALTSPTGPNVSNPNSETFWIMKLTSPDLSTNTAWQNATGFSVYATDGFTYRTGAPRYVNLFVQVYDHDQAKDRFFYSGTAQTIQHSSSGTLSATNGWKEYEFNWASGSFPTNATIKKVMFYVWGTFGSSFTGNFCIDKVYPLGGPILSVSPTELDFGTTETQLSFDISNIGTQNLTWTITGDPTKTWLTSVSPASAVNGATVEVQVDRAMMTGVTDQAVLTVNSNGGTATINVNIQKTTADLPEHWGFTENTGNNATIVLPVAAAPTIDGQPLHDGNYVGLFTAAGLCCGYAKWENVNLAITAWGDDTQTTEVDGFVPDEEVLYRAFSPSMGGVEAGQVTVAYSTGDGNFTPNDYMVLSQFNARTSEVRHYEYPMGWNSFSLNVLPPDPDPEIIFQPVLSHLELMKDGLGQSFIPEFSINTLGDIDPKKGYQMYWKSPVTFDVEGTPVDPIMPIDLVAGWNMIGYLPDTPMDVEVALGGIVTYLVLVKDIIGNTFIPEFGINTIGDMQPGQAYKLYTKAAVTLTYPAPTAGNTAPPVLSRRINEHFEFLDNTGDNAIVVIPGALSVPYTPNAPFDPGDEIGIFTSDGRCCGAAPWSGENLAITVWGDNSMTDSLDGFVANDTLRFRVWKAQANIEYPMTCEYVEGHPCVYKTDGFSVVSSVAVDLESAVTDIFSGRPPQQFHVSQNYPNPFNMETTIEFQLPKTAAISIKIFDIRGQQIMTFSQESIPAGVYQWQWNGYNQNHQEVASGIYYYSFKARTISGDHFTDIHKMTLIK